MIHSLPFSKTILNFSLNDCQSLNERCIFKSTKPIVYNTFNRCKYSKDRDHFSVRIFFLIFLFLNPWITSGEGNFEMWSSVTREARYF